MTAAIVLFLGGVLCGVCLSAILGFFWLSRHMGLVISWLVQSLAQRNRNAYLWVRTEAQWIRVEPAELTDSIECYAQAAGISIERKT